MDQSPPETLTTDSAPPFSSLPGRVAAVTGASSGIGREIARELARGGADVLVHACRNRRGAEETAESIRAMGRESQVILADIADPHHRERLVRQAWEWRDRVDIWVNNAGADVLTGEAATWSFEKKLERLWQVDVLGTIALARAVGAQMRQSSTGRSSTGRTEHVILNVGWDQAEIGMAGDSGEMFAATKGAIMAFTRSLARSLAPRIRVNCLAPGWIRTSWGDQASEYWQRRAVQESLLERWGEPADVARMARYLASSDASFITGQIIAVNGGQRA